MSYYPSKNDKILTMSASDKDYTMSLSENDFRKLCTKQLKQDPDVYWLLLITLGTISFTHENVNYIVVWKG